MFKGSSHHTTQPGRLEVQKIRNPSWREMCCEMCLKIKSLMTTVIKTCPFKCIFHSFQAPKSLSCTISDGPCDSQSCIFKCVQAHGKHTWVSNCPSITYIYTYCAQREMVYTPWSCSRWKAVTFLGVCGNLPTERLEKCPKNKTSKQPECSQSWWFIMDKSGGGKNQVTWRARTVPGRRPLGPAS